MPYIQGSTMKNENVKAWKMCKMSPAELVMLNTIYEIS